MYLSALVRAATLTLADVEREMYEERAVVRIMAMRRTLFAVPVDTSPVVHPGAAPGWPGRCARR